MRAIDTGTMTMRLGCLMVLALLWSWRPALADCEDGVATLTALIGGVTDPHSRAVLTVDLNQAETDLWELDEVECAVAIQHAARFLRRQGGSGGSGG
jgi:hypothetical protein